MMRGGESGASRRVAFAALVALGLSPALMAAETRPADLTTEGLRQRLREAQSRIHSWYIEYESEQGLSTGERRGYLHRVVAAKAPDRFFHWSTHGSSWLDWREDLYQQRLVLAPGVSVVERPMHRQFRSFPLAPGAPLPGTMPGEFLFLALGMWPFPDRPPPSATIDTPSALSAIASSPKYVVDRRQERVQGRWCHIIEYAGHDKLWLDCDRGCVILAREVFEPTEGLLLQRIEAGEFREVQPGIWIPHTFRNMLFNTATSGPQKGKLVKTMDAMLRVVEVRLNDQVGDDLFRFEPRPGSIQTVKGDRLEQALPRGTDYLDELTDWIRRQLGISARKAPDAGSPWEAVVESSIVVAGIVVPIGRFLRRRARRITDSHPAAALVGRVPPGAPGS